MAGQRTSNGEAVTVRVAEDGPEHHGERPASAVVELAGYRVHVGPGLLERLGPLIDAAAPAHRYVVVSDDTVAPLLADRVVAALAPRRVDVLTIPPGEQEKSRHRWAELTDQLLALGCGRDTVVVALGGGVVGDLAGFTAATFLRGIPVVQLPTTLLAMVDASVGGKTAVDVPAGKNLVGAFHAPALVLADTTTLATLPLEQRRAGMAEVLKHGIIADAAYLERTEHALPALLDLRDPDATADVVIRSVRIKAGVVAADEREQGRRKILNFGHTLGHAVEQVSGYTLLHGEAVAIGMVLESRLAERIGVAAAGTADRVRRAVRSAGLPDVPPPGPTSDAALLLAATRHDKKARSGAVEYALPLAIGRMAGAESGWALPVDDAAVRATIDEQGRP